MLAVIAILPWSTKEVIKMKCEAGQCMAYNSGKNCAACMELFTAECCTGFDQEQQKCLLEAIPQEKRFYDMTAWHYWYIRSLVEAKDFAPPGRPFVKCCLVFQAVWIKDKKPCCFILMSDSLPMLKKSALFLECALRRKKYSKKKSMKRVSKNIDQTVATLNVWSDRKLLEVHRSLFVLSAFLRWVNFSWRCVWWVWQA